MSEPDEDEDVVIKKFPHLRADYSTLQDLKSLIEKHESDISRLFLPTMMKLKQTYREGRLALRRRMVQCSVGGDENNKMGTNQQIPNEKQVDNEQLIQNEQDMEEEHIEDMEQFVFIEEDSVPVNMVLKSKGRR